MCHAHILFTPGDHDKCYSSFQLTVQGQNIRALRASQLRTLTFLKPPIYIKLFFVYFDVIILLQNTHVYEVIGLHGRK